MLGKAQMSKALKPEQSGLLMAQREQFLQDRAVVKPASMRPLIRGPGVEGDKIRLTQTAVARIFHQVFISVVIECQQPAGFSGLTRVERQLIPELHRQPIKRGNVVDLTGPGRVAALQIDQEYLLLKVNFAGKRGQPLSLFGGQFNACQTETEQGFGQRCLAKRIEASGDRAPLQTLIRAIKRQVGKFLRAIALRCQAALRAARPCPQG